MWKRFNYSNIVLKVCETCSRLGSDARGRQWAPPSRERARGTHPLSTLEDGSLSIFSLRWTRAARGAAARGTRAHATAQPPCGNADIFEYKYTEKAANFGTGLGWIQPRDRVGFFFVVAVGEAHFSGQPEWNSSTLRTTAGEATDGLSGGKESWKRCLCKGRGAAADFLRRETGDRRPRVSCRSRPDAVVL